MAFDRAALAEFIGQTDKVEPPVFVGRADVFANILAAADRSWDGSGAGKHGQAGATQIIQGAPGAGKSTILGELARRAAARTRTDVKVQVLILNSADINRPEDILQPLAAMVDPAKAKDFLAHFHTTRSGSSQLGVYGSSVGGDHARTTIPHAPAPTLMAFRDWVRDLKSGLFAQRGLRGAIIIAIDEAQRLKGSGATPVAKVLQGIHDNTTSLPLTLVLAGLGDTEVRATDMGLTRGKALHHIAALTAAEVADLTKGWCAHFGLDPAGHEGSLEALVTPCEGWPRHLHFALQALGRDILRTHHASCASPVSVEAVDWERVAATAAMSRLRYYQGQQRGALKECAALVGAVLDDLRSSPLQSFQSRSHVIDSIHRHARAHPDASAWQIPKGMDADTLVDHLFHRGALQLVEEVPSSNGLEERLSKEVLIVPIPSFRTYLVREGARLEVGALLAGGQDAGLADRATVARILAATDPGTVGETDHWKTLDAAWQRHCTALATIREDAAALATPDPITSDVADAHAAAIIAALEGAGETSPPGEAAPPLPRSLPHAQRAVEALEEMVTEVRTAARAVLEGIDDPWHTDTLGNVAALPERAVAATPTQQLDWAIEYLTGITSPGPDVPEESRSSTDP